MQKQIEDNDYVVRMDDGRIIGRIEGDVFIKPVIASKHQLRKPKAWAIDANVFDRTVKSLADWIVIWDKESNTKWKASVQEFDKHKGKLNRGFGNQYFLTLTRFEVIDSDTIKPKQLMLSVMNMN